ncbi:MAG: hypothetical protein GC184_13355 [Rhizobiales bacterium]|nr:hypothetical protein [Hyphomicrobiales bacterium]
MTADSAIRDMKPAARQQRLFGILALVAMLFQFLTPTLDALRAVSTDGLLTTYICSGGVYKLVTIGEDGKPIDTKPANKQHDCTSCVHHCGAALLAHTPRLPLLQLASVSPSLQMGALMAGVVAASNSRAPPS